MFTSHDDMNMSAAILYQAVYVFHIENVACILSGKNVY